MTKITGYEIKLWPASHMAWEPTGPKERQIAVLMSGGVDSSVTASLLKEAGWEVLGITMKIPVSCDTGIRSCCGTEATVVSRELGIPHYFVDVTRAFQELIVENFRQVYAQGHTPNPCADCNTFLKFSLVWDFIETQFGVNFLATGHYAKVSQVNGQYRLGMAGNKPKDQSYFLYGIEAARLSKFMLPLGDMEKEQVRARAAALGLSIADKPESMELCFAGEGDYRVALSAEQANREGDITDMRGEVIGKHKGIANYTIGQRRGIGYAGGEPLYVGRIDAASNTISLGTREEVSCASISATDLNILIPEECTRDAQVRAKIRSYGEANPCRIAALTDDSITVEFDTPQFAPSPGQKLVLYNTDDSIIVGGTIRLP
jgi:tRNA-uridine 2-sulfurtransferase